VPAVVLASSHTGHSLAAHIQLMHLQCEEGKDAEKSSSDSSSESTPSRRLSPSPSSACKSRNQTRSGAAIPHYGDAIYQLP